MRSRKKRLLGWILQTAVLTILLSAVLALPEVIKIGGIFETTEEQQELAFRYAIDSINTNSGILPRSRLSAQVMRVAAQDSFRALKTACDYFEEGIAGLFGPPSPSTAGSLQSACDKLQIPYFQTHWDYKSRHRSYTISLYPDTKTLATAFLDVISMLEWKSFTIIYEDNEALMRLQEVVQQPTAKGVKVRIRHVDPDQDYKKLIKDLKKSREYNFIVDLPLHNVEKLFADAKEMEWMTTYQTYLLTTLDIHTVQWNPEVVKQPNITSFRIVDPGNENVRRVVKDWIFSEKRQGRRVNNKQPLLTETALIYDGIDILARALDELDSSQTIDLKSLYCHDTFQWHHGKSITNYIKLKPRHGLSGEIKFDSNGLRKFFQADLMKLTTKGVPVKIGTWDTQNGMHFHGPDTKHVGDYKDILQSTEITLRVATIISEPYVMRKEPAEGEILEGNERYEGFCVDVLDELSDLKNFKFIIDILDPPAHGSNNTGEWDGMIGKLMKREADLAIADLTITHIRESVVDFTHPFMTIGISILFKKSTKTPPSLFSFTDPLSLEVWFYMATAFLGVSLLLFITARLSPYEWVNPHPCETENTALENDFTLLNSFWFTIGSIMQQGSDILPRAVSTRIIASSWWFFTMIMISSYTANLAAFLTAQRMVSPIESVHDLAKQTKIIYGALGGGSTQNFFKNSEYPMYKRMWSFMESHRPSVFTKSNPEGIERVKAGNYAFLMESTTIEYQVERQCELTKIGGELDAKGYGIAMPKGSPFLNILNNGILEMQEKGSFHKMKERWWRSSSGCEHEKPPSAEMGIRNVAGVFLVVAIGVIAGFIIVVFEYIWKSKKIMDRDPIPLMLWRDFRDIFRGRGSSRPVPKYSEEPSVEKLPMMNLRTNPNTESGLFS